jgi:hypothetical protein
MIKQSRVVALGFVSVLLLPTAGAGAALAQTPFVGASPAPPAGPSSQSSQDFSRMQALNMTNNQALKTRAQVAIRDARSIVDDSRVQCDVAVARSVGFTKDKHEMFEVACKEATGFIVDTSTKSPRAFDCKLLAAEAAQAQAAGAVVPATSLCALPANVKH